MFFQHLKSPCLKDRVDVICYLQNYRQWYSTWGLYHESIIAPNEIDELQIYEFSFPFYLPKWFTKWPMFCIFTMLYWVRNNGFTYCSACTMNVKPIVKKNTASMMTSEAQTSLKYGHRYNFQILLEVLVLSDLRLICW